MIFDNFFFCNRKDKKIILILIKRTVNRTSIIIWDSIEEVKIMCLFFLKVSLGSDKNFLILVSLAQLVLTKIQ